MLCSGISTFTPTASAEEMLSAAQPSYEDYLSTLTGDEAELMATAEISWSIDAEGTFTIAGSGAMPSWTSAEAVPWHSRKSEIKSVKILSGLTTIGDRAFMNCPNLKNVSIPYTVTAIGYSAFSECDSLISIIVPYSVKSLGYGTFSNCDHLQYVSLSYGLTTLADYTFSDCVNLKQITLPESVTSVGRRTFQNCRSLESVKLSDKITTLGSHSFYDCNALTTITLPKSLTTVEGWLFAYCDNLSYVVVPEGVTRIGGSAFRECGSMTDVTIPASVTEIGPNVLDYSYNVNSIYYLGTKDQWNSIAIDSDNARLKDTSSITKFYWNGSYSCGDNLTWSYKDGMLAISGTGDMYDWTSYPNVPWHSRRRMVEKVVLGTGVASVGEYAFIKFSNMTDLTITSTVKSIGPSAFYQCTGLTQVNIPDSVTEIDSYAFYNCSGLTQLKLPANITTINNAAFSGCSSLESVSVPESVTTIDTYAFRLCTNLKTLNLGSNLQSINTGAFNKCTALTDVYYNGSEAKWNTVSVASANEGLTNATMHFVMPETITLNKSSAELFVDETLTLIATVAPELADQGVIWSTSDEQILTVNENGLVTAIGIGNGVITATSAVDADISASCAISVIPKIPPVITVSEETVKAGKEVAVTLTLSDNWGFANLGIEIGYDKNAMTLKSAVSNIEGADFVYDDYGMIWNSPSSCKYNGTLVTLTFEINKATNGGKYPVTVASYKGESGNYTDGVDVNYTVGNHPLNTIYNGGEITVLLPGDINGDNKVNNKDGVCMLRLLADWDVEVVESALDVDGNGTFETKDCTTLLRYLAGWNIEIN